MTDATMPTEARRQKVHRVATHRQQGVVVLEDIHDIHNASAVYRSADAFGVQAVHLIFLEEEPFDPREQGKISSASANRWLDFHVHDSTETCLKQLKEDGYTLIATTLDEDAQSIYEARFDQDEKIAFLLGNERRGLTETAKQLADRKLYVPMRGMIQSLNLSVTAAICLFEMTRQRLEAGMDGFLISDNERQALEKRMIER